MKTKTLLAVLAVFSWINFMSRTTFASAEEPGRVRAPDFTGADGWLNTDKPLSIKDLKGQVVVLDFWTYCCINCMHIFPDLKYIEEKYKDQPVVVIGVHSGKFSEEKDPENIRQAVLRHNLSHPVCVDSDMKIWEAYAVRAWPTLVVIDSEGYVAGQTAGEGHRQALDHAISTLLEQGRRKGTLGKHMSFHTERQKFKSGTLEFPGKVLADEPGNRLFISDTNHNRVLVTDLEGKIRQTIGSGNIGRRDGSFANAEFHQPQGLALSADGKELFIADTENHLIRSADLVRQTVTTIAGNGTQAPLRPHVNGPARREPLSSPWDLARVGSKLYIAMAGVHQIWVLDLAGGYISTFAGKGVESDIDGPNSAACFAQPSGLATDGKTLYVADSEASSIRAVSLGPDAATHTLAGSANLFGFGKADGIGPAARFQHPLGVALAPDGSLFIADTFNSAIREINTKTAQVTHWLAGDSTGLGTTDHVGLYEPGGLCLAGNTLYIADTNHHRILAVDLTTKKAKVILGGE